MRLLVTFFILAEVLPSLPLGAANSEKIFEGTITVTERRGDVSVQTIYTRKGDKLRIEDADKSKPEPSNLVDLGAQKLTIIYPHNSSFVVVDLNKTPAQSGTSNLSPGFPGSPSPNPTSASAPPGPAISPPPGFPTPPPMPSMPHLPNSPAVAGLPPPPQMPNNPMASSAPGMPMPPSQGFGPPGMPPMPATGGFGAAPKLKKTDKTKKIQGFDCTLYTISERMETFEIWATSDTALFHFQLLQANYRSRHFGPQMLEDQWVALLKEQSLWPLEATLRMEGNGPERYSFKVDEIEPKKIENASLFKPPENYQEIVAPVL